MFKPNSFYRKLDPLTLLVIFVVLAVLMTSAVDAAEPFTRTSLLMDLEDGDAMLAPVGKEGAGVYMWYQTGPGHYNNRYKTALSPDPVVATPSVFLFVRVPWK